MAREVQDIDLNVRDDSSFQQEGNTGGEFNEDDDSSMNSLQLSGLKNGLLKPEADLKQMEQMKMLSQKMKSFVEHYKETINKFRQQDIEMEAMKLENEKLRKENY